MVADLQDLKKFRNLKYGEVFYFEREINNRFSSSPNGPWVKGKVREYRHIDDMRIEKIGSINTYVYGVKGA